MAVLLKSKKCYGKIPFGKEVYEESSAIWGPKGRFLVSQFLGHLLEYIFDLK